MLPVKLLLMHHVFHAGTNYSKSIPVSAFSQHLMDLEMDDQKRLHAEYEVRCDLHFCSDYISKATKHSEGPVCYT